MLLDDDCAAAPIIAASQATRPKIAMARKLMIAAKSQIDATKPDQQVLGASKKGFPTAQIVADLDHDGDVRLILSSVLASSGRAESVVDFLVTGSYMDFPLQYRAIGWAPDATVRLKT